MLRHFTSLWGYNEIEQTQNLASKSKGKIENKAWRWNEKCNDGVMEITMAAESQVKNPHRSSSHVLQAERREAEKGKGNIFKKIAECLRRPEENEAR